MEPLQATLAGFRKRHPDIHVEWQARSLHGFEFQPVTELARDFDLIVLDHPFCGEIAASSCMLPQEHLADLDSCFVGPSLETYRYAGQIWALPIDAASQVSVARPDLMAKLGAPMPATWDEVFHLGERARRAGLSLAIGLKGVHSLMTFFFLCANLGHPPATEPGSAFLDRRAALEALRVLRELLTFCPPDALGWSSIDLHEAMAAGESYVYCPVVYLYATYAEGDHRRPLEFGDLPGLNGATPAGSAIGGTGLAISTGCAHPQAALAYARYLLEPEVQKDFAAHHGQPARVEAWDDPGLDQRFGKTFSATRRSIESSWIRPRYRGYLRAQAEGGDLVEAHLRGDVEATAVINRLEAMHRRAGAGQG
jgi:multiple sugar transport system substrate-binding protein